MVELGSSSPNLPQRLRELGFSEHPFRYFEAEGIPEDIQEETFVVHPGFDQHVMNLDRSTVLLAQHGGGKTASRLRVSAFLAKRQQAMLKNPESEQLVADLPLVISYTNFERIVPELPDVTLAAHLPLLRSCIAEAILKFIEVHPFHFMTAKATCRDWCWAYLEKYLEGTSLEYRLHDEQILYDYQSVTSRSSALRANMTVENTLRTIINQLANLSIGRLFILVDGVDGLLETRELASAEAIVAPLLNALSLLSLPNLLWKFFLPVSLKAAVLHSTGYQTGRLNLVEIEWNLDSLVNLLHRRLEWASEGTVKDVDEICVQELSQKVDVEHELAQMALHHQRLGPPRALIELGNRLFSALKPPVSK